MILGTNPDVSIIGIIGGLVPSDGVAAGASDAVATTTTAGASALGGLVVGPGLMTYFIDCDTNDNITNTFNVRPSTTTQCTVVAALG